GVSESASQEPCNRCCIAASSSIENTRAHTTCSTSTVALMSARRVRAFTSHTSSSSCHQPRGLLSVFPLSAAPLSGPFPPSLSRTIRDDTGVSRASCYRSHHRIAGGTRRHGHHSAVHAACRRSVHNGQATPLHVVWGSAELAYEA